MANCLADLTYEIGDGYFPCTGEANHTGKHKTTVKFAASTSVDPFLYELAVVVEWD